MIRLNFIGRGGTVTTADVEPDGTLLAAAQSAGQPLEGTCGGDMACATCHVIIDAQDFGRLTHPVPDEEDMLDLVPQATRTSRLACQIHLTAALDGLTASIPAER